MHPRMVHHHDVRGTPQIPAVRIKVKCPFWMLPDPRLTRPVLSAFFAFRHQRNLLLNFPVLIDFRLSGCGPSRRCTGCKPTSPKTHPGGCVSPSAIGALGPCRSY
uniref:(northern house mosquito) hypothetical protein n=1 Tax=Culex pipiens TaxID=7175 RepID=A0A8D8F566_CULPI